MNTKEVSEYTVKCWLDYGSQVMRYIERLESTLNEGAGKIEEVEPYPRMPEFFESGIALRPSWADNGKKSPDTCKKQLQDWYDECVRIRERNAPKLQNNSVVKQRAKTYFMSMGLPEKVSRLDYGRSGKATPKRVSERAGWVVSLDNIPTVDQFDFATSGKDAQLRKIEQIETKLKAEVEAKDRAIQAQEEARVKQVSYIAALIKAGIPETTRPEDALNALLEKDKYLRLAHFMMMNRNDWNEGCDYAETGLSGFAVESDEDRAIYKCVSDQCGDGWDGDGRCFRDCKYNYDYLFGKVQSSDPGLYEAYTKIREMCSL